MNLNLAAQFTVLGFQREKVYKKSIISNIISALLESIFLYALWNAVYSTGQIKGEFSETFAYLMLMRVISSLYGNITRSFSDDVKTGNIAFLLIRPYFFEMEYIFSNLGSSLFRFITKGWVYVLFLVSVNQYDISSLGAIIVLIFFGYFLNTFFELTIAVSSFYNYSIWGIESLKDAIQLLFSGSYFPAFLYPQFLLTISSFLPFYYCYAIIGELMMSFSSAAFLSAIGYQLFFIVIMMVIYILVKSRAIKKLTIQGG